MIEPDLKVPRWYDADVDYHQRFADRGERDVGGTGLGELAYKNDYQKRTGRVLERRNRNSKIDLEDEEKHFKIEVTKIFGNKNDTFMRPLGNGLELYQQLRECSLVQRSRSSKNDSVSQITASLDEDLALCRPSGAACGITKASVTPRKIEMFVKNEHAAGRVVPQWATIGEFKLSRFVIDADLLVLVRSTGYWEVPKSFFDDPSIKLARFNLQQGKVDFKCDIDRWYNMR